MSGGRRAKVRFRAFASVAWLDHQRVRTCKPRDSNAVFEYSRVSRLMFSSCRTSSSPYRLICFRLRTRMDFCVMLQLFGAKAPSNGLILPPTEPPVHRAWEHPY
ncbi:hypothetical protein DOTSEDRAFT_68890 [Dothistroma septosporum NZE10]|uniref:Uncharacterized protein n=1 Tax=Dothistroma septosporum (strain NZE10 / CBS 128990) TaxID=675120 RepID=N1Q331_DOTSN|nr:hypothetical protein DOTSEDRAFT_68890 [Dothistroma septosporum NZE10]